jgi:hypothetical protein
VRIGQADNLARVARIGENFLIAGETCVENDFAAAPRLGAGGSSIKNSSVFERKNRGAYDLFCQRTLPRGSFCSLGVDRNRPEMVDRPVGEHSFPVNKLSRYGAEDARIIGAGAVVAHHKILPVWDYERG